MSNPSFLIRPLDLELDRSRFDCGNDSLNRYLQQQAGQDIRRRAAAVYMLVDVTLSVTVGYYTLSASSIKLNDLPEAYRRRLPRYPLLPATLLGRLAVDRTFQGQGLGEILLFNALERVVELSTQVGIFAVTVDAIDDSAAVFYRRYGFRDYGTSAPQQLFLRVADAVAVLSR